MRKVLIFIFGFLLSYGFVEAGKDKKEEKSVIPFKVIVIDAETEDSIPAAKVKVGKNEAEAYTDFDGSADFEGLIQGRYDIEVSFISYKKQQISAYQLDKLNHQLLIKLNP